MEFTQTEGVLLLGVLAACLVALYLERKLERANAEIREMSHGIEALVYGIGEVASGRAKFVPKAEGIALISIKGESDAKGTD